MAMKSSQNMDSLTFQTRSDSFVDDQILIRNAKDDISAFSPLYDLYANQVYRYLLVRVGNVHDAEDLTSQTFMAAMMGLKSYREQSPFAAWLLGIARNKTVDIYRQRHLVMELDEKVETADSGDSLDDVVDKRMALEKVANKLLAISPTRAEALSLQLFGGLKIAEVAQIMNKQKSAVRMLVFRGIRDLAAQLNVDQERMS